MRVLIFVYEEAVIKLWNFLKFRTLAAFSGNAALGID
jgi:hypothetical protein